MSNTPTRTAVAGRFQSKTGEDLIQLVESDGNVARSTASCPCDV